jgi:hypothetical protein
LVEGSLQTTVRPTTEGASADFVFRDGVLGMKLNIGLLLGSGD